MGRAVATKASARGLDPVKSEQRLAVPPAVSRARRTPWPPMLRELHGRCPQQAVVAAQSLDLPEHSVSVTSSFSSPLVLTD